MSGPATPEIFRLSAAERASPLWLRLKAHLNERLAKARTRNDGALAPDETARLRGRIACLKDLLALEEDRPPIDGWRGEGDG
jgi:hypothetical protein